MTFYRYIRPVKFDGQRMALVTQPRGGVCLRFDENDDGTLTFAYASCPDTELFSKEVAKRMVDWRASKPAYKATVPRSKNTDVLLEHVMDWCSWWKPDGDWEAASYYTVYDLRCFADALASLALKNKTEEMKLQTAKDVIQALDTKRMYKEKTK